LLIFNELSLGATIKLLGKQSKKQKLMLTDRKGVVDKPDDPEDDGNAT
jgi:hypothetical protein